MTTPRRRRRPLLLALALIALAVAGAYGWRVSRPAAPTSTLVEPLARGAFVREVTGTGVVEAALERSLGFTSGGTIAALEAVEGDRVVAGQPLARLDDTLLRRELESVRASLASAAVDRDRLTAQQAVDRLDLEAAVAQADDQRARSERAAEDARRELVLARRLFELGASSREQLRAAEAGADAADRTLAQSQRALETARSRLAGLDQLAAAQRASAAAQRTQLETQLANLEARLTDTVLVAPFAGVVTAVMVKPGDLVGSQPLLTLADTSELRVRGRFDENRALELAAGQAAVVVPDADATRRLPAVVERLSPVAAREAGTAQVTVLLSFDASAELDATLTRPGYTVTVRVRVRDLGDALLMPLEAITERDGASFVWRVAATGANAGVAERVDVTVLERNPTVAAVTGDLQAGDLIAVIGLDALYDGVAVTFPATTPRSGRGGS
mgnify:CR=1 FL=1